MLVRSPSKSVTLLETHHPTSDPQPSNNKTIRIPPSPAPVKGKRSKKKKKKKPKHRRTICPSSAPVQATDSFILHCAVRDRFDPARPRIPFLWPNVRGFEGERQCALPLKPLAFRSVFGWDPGSPLQAKSIRSTRTEKSE